jgi:hypothetical protein
VKNTVFRKIKSEKAVFKKVRRSSAMKNFLAHV